MVVLLIYKKSGSSKISNAFLFLFSNKMLVFRAGIHKMLVRIANRKDLIRLLLQKQSDLDLALFAQVFDRQLAFKVFEHLLWIDMPLVMSVYQKISFLISHLKHVVGIQKNHLNEAVFLNTLNIC